MLIRSLATAAVSRLCLGLSLSLSSAPVFADSSPPSPEGVTSALATVQLLDQSQVFFAAAVKRQRKERALNDAEVNQLLSLSKRMYQGANLYPVFKKAYGRYAKPSEVTAAFTWLSSVTGLKFRQSLLNAYKADAKAREDFFGENAEKILRHNRKNAIASFTKTWLQNDLYEAYQKGMDFAVLMAFKGSPEHAGDKETPAQLKERLRQTRDFDREATESFKVFNFYLFKDMKNEEIDDLTKFAYTLPGIAHMKAYVKALESTLESAALTLQAQVIKSGKPRPDGQP